MGSIYKQGEFYGGGGSGGSSGVTSFNGRSGSIMPTVGDYSDDKIILSSAMHIGGETQTNVSEALNALVELIYNNKN